MTVVKVLVLLDESITDKNNYDVSNYGKCQMTGHNGDSDDFTTILSVSALLRLLMNCQFFRARQVFLAALVAINRSNKSGR